MTGDASGLGRAAAEALYAAGAKVAILDVNAKAAEQVASELGGLAAACDKTSVDDTTAALIVRVSRDCEHGIHRIVSRDFAGL